MDSSAIGKKGKQIGLVEGHKFADKKKSVIRAAA